MTLSKTTNQIKEIYKFTGDLSLTLLRESSDNSVYILSDINKKYILRISQKDKKEQINFEAELINQLRLNNFPVAKLIINKKGDYYSLLNDSLICVISEFIEGKQIDITVDSKPKSSVVLTAASILAELHNSSNKITLTHSTNRTIFYELEKILDNKDLILKNYENGAVFISEVESMIDWGKRQEEDQGIIHNDFRSHNLIFSEDLRKVAAVIDFDWSCKGPFIKDLAHTLCEWSFPDGAELPWDDIFDCFLSSYNAHSKIKFEDMQNLKKWIAFACLSDAATYFYDRIKNNSLNKNVLSSYMYKKYCFYSSK